MSAWEKDGSVEEKVIEKKKVDVKVALKFDEEKTPWDLMPFEAIEGMLDVLAYGKNKYTRCSECGLSLPGQSENEPCPDCNGKIVSGADNWRKGFSWRRLYAAACRHLAAFMKGEEVDESGNSHLSHALCMIAFLSEHYTQGYGEDDRFIYKQYKK